MPEASPENGQLRRFVDLFGAGFDHLRSRADGLRDLHEVDTVDYRMLPHLAAWLGWDLSHDKPIPLQRHEIKYAAALYRITGTLPGSMIWVKRLTGWDARVKEFWRNVFFTNDLGNPDDPDDRGSRTLDTSDAGLLAGMGTFDDAVDYVSDSGHGPGRPLLADDGRRVRDAGARRRRGRPSCRSARASCRTPAPSCRSTCAPSSCSRPTPSRPSTTRPSA